MERGCQNCFLQSLLYLSKRLDLTQSFKSVINFAITESQAGREGVETSTRISPLLYCLEKPQDLS